MLLLTSEKHKEWCNNFGKDAYLFSGLNNKTPQYRTLQLAKHLNTIPLPQEILTSHKVSHEEVIRRKPSSRLDDCVFEVAKRAYAHLRKAEKLMEKFPKEARDVMLPFVPVEMYLVRLEKLQYQILHPDLQRLPWMWLPKLWTKYFMNKF